MKSVNTLTAKEKFLVVRTIRKKQFCKWEEKPNPNYKPELNDTRVPVFDTKQVPKLRNTLVCKGKMVDGTDVCKFPERFLRSVSVIPPKKPPPSNACKVKVIKALRTEFKRQYHRGDLPLYIVSTPGCKRHVAWKVHYGEVDFIKFLPIFFEGIKEKKDPLMFLARNGVRELLQYVDIATLTEALAPIAHQIYALFDSNDKDIICETLKVIQNLVLTHPSIGPELVPHYRYILPGMRVFKNRNKNLGDTFEYGQKKRRNTGDLIDETLEILEMYGGEAAFYHIKRIVPLYTSKHQILTSLPAEEKERKRGKLLTKSQFMGTSPSSTIFYDRPKTR